MRALLVMAVIVTLGGVAHADMIDIQDPPIVMACPHATTWPLVLACVKQHGLAVTVVRALDDANLVALTTNDKAATFQGFVLYVHPDTGPWRIGGLTQNGGSLSDYEILRLEHVNKRGYRFDVALAQRSSASLDDVTSVSMFNHEVIAAFCTGTSYSCLEIVQKCEQIVRGQAISAFDGAITVHDNTVSLKGAGTTPACSANAEYHF